MLGFRGRAGFCIIWVWLGYCWAPGRMPPLIDLDIFRILLIDYQWGPQIDLINLSLNLILSRILLKTGYNWAPAEILKPWIIWVELTIFEPLLKLMLRLKLLKIEIRLSLFVLNLIPLIVQNLIPLIVQNLIPLFVQNLIPLFVQNRIPLFVQNLKSLLFRTSNPFFVQNLKSLCSEP